MAFQWTKHINKYNDSQVIDKSINLIINSQTYSIRAQHNQTTIKNHTEFQNPENSPHSLNKQVRPLSETSDHIFVLIPY